MTAICPDECERMARYTEAFVGAVKTRLLPALEELAPSVRKEAEEVFEAVVVHTGRYDEPDYDMASEAAQEVEVDALDDLAFVSDQILSLAIAGLYHLWERTMRRVLIRAIRFRLPVPNQPTTERASHDELLQALWGSGQHRPAPLVLAQLRELRLIANVVKHGSGGSLRDLVADFPQRFYEGDVRYASPEFPMLSPDDLDTFGGAVAAFWRSINPPAS